MRVQLTSVEKLNIEHPGLQLDVDTMLQKDTLLDDIRAMLRNKYGASLSHQSLSRYKQKRWLPSLQRIQDRVEHSQAIIQVIKKEGDSDFARAYIFEQLDESARRGDRVEPATLLREQRMRMELQLRFKQLKQSDRKLKFFIQQAAQELDESTRKAAKEAGGHLPTIADINRIRERVFGLPPITPESAKAGPDPQVIRRRIRDIFGLEREEETQPEPESVPTPALSGNEALLVAVDEIYGVPPKGNPESGKE